MNVYLDASALVPIFLDDAFSARIDAYLRRPLVLHVSDFASAEFASALGLKIRTGELTKSEAREAFLDFDRWKSATNAADTLSADIRAAEAILRRLDLGLRTPDALHIVIAQRLACELITFDDRMAEAARVLGVKVADG